MDPRSPTETDSGENKVNNNLKKAMHLQVFALNSSIFAPQPGGIFDLVYNLERNLVFISLYGGAL